MKGVFGLNSYADLLRKLEWEFEQLTAEPTSAYVAYNFFVTAWHLLEWRYSDPYGTSTRNEIKDKTPLLQICEHLAVGAKHFEPGNPKLKSVSDSRWNGAWAPGAWAKGAWKFGAWKESLSVSLTGEAQILYGDRIEVLELARMAMNYWKAAP
jgi:hypothetical protein